MMLWVYKRIQMFTARRSIRMFCFISKVFKKTDKRYLEKIENDIKNKGIPKLSEEEKKEMYNNIVHFLKKKGAWKETEEC